MMKVFLLLPLLCQGVSISRGKIGPYNNDAISGTSTDPWGDQLITNTARVRYLPKWVDTDGTGSLADDLTSYPTGHNKKFVWSEAVSESSDTADFKLDNYEKKTNHDSTFGSTHQDRAKFQEQIGRNNADSSDNAGKKSWRHHQHFNEEKIKKRVKGNPRGANDLTNEDIVDTKHSALDYTETGKEDDNNDLAKMKIDTTFGNHLNTSAVVSKLGRKVNTITTGNNSAGVTGEGSFLKNANAGTFASYTALVPGDAQWTAEKKTLDYANVFSVDKVEPMQLENAAPDGGTRLVHSLKRRGVDTATHVNDLSKLDYMKRKYYAPACVDGQWEGTNGCIYRIGAGAGKCNFVGDTASTPTSDSGAPGVVEKCTASNGVAHDPGSASSGANTKKACGLCRPDESGADGETYAAMWFKDA